MKRPAVTIIPFEKEYTECFAKLNLEWLETYFVVEDYDRKVLENPQKYILDEGGHIFFALVGGQVAGTVALIYRGDEGFELSKMAVTKEFQGLRIGQKLMYACIHFAGQQSFRRLFLDSNTILTPAINLYRKVGFREIPVPGSTPYARCNIRMELLV
ncbi:MAG: GNAT family N-acetyltransferase [Robiginitalea sp.]|uniref:GNAT family N-acetyltransferase n=1 Tax=Robiginitalea sp. TaxID=1902411 RepID=UPI003C738780